MELTMTYSSHDQANLGDVYRIELDLNFGSPPTFFSASLHPI